MSARGRVTFGACVFLAFMALLSQSASVLAAGTGEPQGVPFGFKVPASNGWAAVVLGGENPKTGEGAVQLVLRKGREGAFYETRSVSFNETTVTASFGALGEIDVHSVETGGTTMERSSCGGKPVTYASGSWEGTIDFHGEEGFTSIEASSAPAEIASLLDLLCGEAVNEGVGGHSPGALLTLRRRHGREEVQMTARKNKRDGPSRFSASIDERRGKVLIDRAVSVVGTSEGFGFEIPPGTATVDPHGPFSGSLSFTRRKGSRPSVKGDLTVDFSGHANVSILGPGKLRATLQRAVLNPSHPF